MDKNIFRKINYGMYIISTYENDKQVGCVINTLSQITSSNPIISISLNKENYTSKILKETKICSISILSENTSKETISKFGYYSSKDTNKFENISTLKVNNLTIVNDNICGYIIGNVINIIDCETHDIFLIRVSDTKVLNELNPMSYKYYHDNFKGLSPLKAPTYIEENKSNSKRYKCIICGYIYDDEKEEVKFEDLSDDWVCPLCGVSKDKFVLMDN